MKIIYSEEKKQEVLEYAEKFGFMNAVRKFNVSSYALTRWRGWERKNQKQTNQKWYATKGKEYYSIEENKEKHRQNARNFKSVNPEKNKGYGKKSRDRSRFKKLAEYSNRNFFRKKIKDYYKLTAFDLWKIAKKQKLICPFTGEKLTKENMSVDHIVPVSKGGSNEPSNIRLIHKWVNLMLGIHSDEDFFAMCRKIVEYNNGKIACATGKSPSLLLSVFSNSKFCPFRCQY